MVYSYKTIMVYSVGILPKAKVTQVEQNMIYFTSEFHRSVKYQLANGKTTTALINVLARARTVIRIQRGKFPDTIE